MSDPLDLSGPLEEFETPTEKHLGDLGVRLFSTTLGSPTQEKTLLASIYAEGQTIWLNAPTEEREKVRRHLAHLVCSFYKTCGDRCFTRVDKYVIAPVQQLESGQTLGPLATYQSDPAAEAGAFAQAEVEQPDPIRTIRTEGH
jgi:hypothetical protein